MREPPGNLPFVVQQNLVLDIVQQWESPALSLCDLQRRVGAAAQHQPRRTAFTLGIIGQLPRTFWSIFDSSYATPFSIK